VSHDGRCRPAAPTVSVAEVAHTDVSVQRQPDGTFKVDVSTGRTQTSHVVTVPTGAPAQLGADQVTPEDLVRVSFTFLLEREPATSILRRFSLTQIADYFPDYPQEIRHRLGGAD